MDARSTYRHTSGQDASPVRLIVSLYEQLAEDLRRARRAIDENDIEARTNHLGHALTVLGQLDGCLDMKAGQQVAQDLSRFYAILRAGLLQVQFHPDRKVLEEFIAQVLSLREAWCEVDRQNSKAASGGSSQKSPLSEDDQQSAMRADWTV